MAKRRVLFSKFIIITLQNLVANTVYQRKYNDGNVLCYRSEISSFQMMERKNNVEDCCLWIPGSLSCMGPSATVARDHLYWDELSLELMLQTMGNTTRRKGKEWSHPNSSWPNIWQSQISLSNHQNPSTFVHQVHLIAICTHPASNAWDKTPACCCSISIASEYSGDSCCSGDVESRDPSGFRGKFVMGPYPRRKFREVCRDGEDGG